ncbi:pyrimidine-nucleoside phosphorylase [Iocasia frigidifontis]|uniref:Pyrimidine-nucleoside phosphorylase n=1 Tax=Iocasia fonsfrigidae TaxID=2682810 RepID=A0A8A7KI01_9FIRM|nr:pyrimidine-nucleoside phosphorylase [Iocasia fonsfrigidae]QTL98487.1 pyrimidine-nucleoside phosphorylase [Iocasia fonsfrigidae]
MRPYDIIYKKREGQKLSPEEIRYLINEYTAGKIPDYQVSAWAMAVFFQGMDAEETADLTMAMAESGDILDLSEIEGIKVDKHSTGGVGDTTTLVLAPLVASAGVPVAKLSGRGLGHTGGTIDKLESIPGFKTSLSREEFINNVNNVGVAVAGQTANLTPADKKLYGLRDVTATIESIPLIASSIMSKKIAGGADGIVLDVKVGNGAFMKGIDEAHSLGKAMVAIGHEVGRETIAVLTNMDQPLGQAVGNSLELKEAIQTLRGKGPNDLRELSLILGANMLTIAKGVDNFNEGYSLLSENLSSGKALCQFKKFIGRQGADPAVVDDLELLPEAENVIEIKSRSDGFISSINAREIGLTVMMIGGGRVVKDDAIDPAVGVVLLKKNGEEVLKGETIAKLYLNDLSHQQEAVKRLEKAFVITDEEPSKKDLVIDIIK